MRQRFQLIALVAASTALADPKLAANDPKAVIDARPMLDKLEVFKDEYGKFFVSMRPDAVDDMDEAGKWVFYGDLKGLYQQRIVGTSKDGPKLEWTLWSPRVRGMQYAEVVQKAGETTMTCEYKGSKYVNKKLEQLPADQAKTFLQKATLHPPLWQRESRLLARDDEGVYYFVDALREEFGGHGERVFVGPKGQMKEMPMKNVVADSAGEIYATSGGELKLISSKDSKDEKKAYWRKGGKKEELTLLVPQENRYMIYAELGMYGTIGVVCDNN
jgi:hypothetical protein